MQGQCSTGVYARAMQYRCVCKGNAVQVCMQGQCSTGVYARAMLLTKLIMVSPELYLAVFV